MLYWNLAVGVIGMATALLTWFHKSFARIHFGPIFILEWTVWIAFIFVVLAFREPQKSPTQTLLYKKTLETLRTFWPATIFFALGAFRLLLDLPFQGDFESRIARRFAPQYSLIWVYPLLWGGIAFFFHRHQPRTGRFWLVLILLAQIIPGIWDERYHSVALGPIFLSVAWIYLAAHLTSPNRFRQIMPWVIAIALTVIAVLPMWRMWYWNRASRTAFVIAVALLAALPLLFALFKKHFGIVASVTASVLIALIWGTGTMTFKPWSMLSLPSFLKATPLSSETVAALTLAKPALKSKFMDVMQHSEDKPVGGEETGPFQGRTRKMMWRLSIKQWREQPLMGVGFMRFVPIIRGPGVINDVSRAGDQDSYRPINGTHNSYLTILARMGIAGAFCFLILLLFIAKETFEAFGNPLHFQTRRRLSLDDFFVPLLVSGLISGSIYALFNVGFENPQNGLLFWFFAGLLIAENRNRREQNS